MLPCEFCEELYPEELLIDHQVGCELLEALSFKEELMAICAGHIGVAEHMKS